MVISGDMVKESSVCCYLDRAAYAHYQKSRPTSKLCMHYHRGRMDENRFILLHCRIEPRLVTAHHKHNVTSS